ncbi:MAG: glycosyltransferase [Candidatus Absconditabacterales bacterium]|nr:glycosyltransferase [Candidatus Absconditabacterales bacterium]
MVSHITIITTTYRHQHFIARTIDSILAQTYTNRTLLIGDDSPDDETWTIIQRYVAHYPDKIKARHHTPNKGIVDNMRFLIAHIPPNTNFVAFLEGDDMMTPDNLTKKLDIFAHNPHLGIVYSDIAFIDADDTIILPSLHAFRRIPSFKNQSLTMDEIIRLPLGPVVSWSNMMVPKKVLDQFPPRDCINEPKKNSISDYDFQCQVASSYPIYCIDEQLVHYRRHTSNTSGITNPHNPLYSLDKLIIFYYQEKLITDETMQRKRANLYATFALMALERGDKASAWTFRRQSRSFSLTSSLMLKLASVPFFFLPIARTQTIIKKIVKR